MTDTATSSPAASTTASTSSDVEPATNHADAPEAPSRVVHWYTCSCQWLSKFCDEYHRASSRVPVSVLREHLLTDLISSSLPAVQCSTCSNDDHETCDFAYRREAGLCTCTDQTHGPLDLPSNTEIETSS